jgi:peptidoglycan/LPS O-acetylase OafA/YrhL
MIAPTTTSRRYDLDWLRVFAILAVFFYHSARFFDLDSWHIKNAVTYGWVQARSDFMALWMMPLIFLISGASIFYALNKGGPGLFVKDKVLRLFIPLLAGIFTHVTLQVYLERVSRGQFVGTYFEFLPHYFDGLYTEGGSGNFAWMGLHLWYLLVLFAFSLLLLPLFYALKRKLALPVVLFLRFCDHLERARAAAHQPTALGESGHRSGAGDRAAGVTGSGSRSTYRSQRVVLAVHHSRLRLQAPELQHAVPAICQ